MRVEEKGRLVPRWLLTPKGKGAFYYTVTVCVSWMLCGRDQHPIEKGYSASVTWVKVCMWWGVSVFVRMACTANMGVLS